MWLTVMGIVPTSELYSIPVIGQAPDASAQASS